VTQLESVSEIDSYNRNRSHHSESVEMQDDIAINKFYEVKKVVDKRIRKYDNISVTQYLIR
jgi:hypothetical protein